MRLDHPDYILLVTEDYYRKCQRKELSLLISNPTPANIRDECLNVFSERFQREDEPVLRAFFGPERQDDPYPRIIGRFDIDRFKPLNNYLQRKTDRTENRNLELLAWLIDFPYRPFVFGMEVQLTAEEMAIVGRNGRKTVDEPTARDIVNVLDDEASNEVPDLYSAVGNLDEIEEKEEKVSEQKEMELPPIRTNGINKLLAILLALMLGLGGWYVWQQNNRNESLNYGALLNGCMYWREDHYVEAPCNEIHAGRLLLPLNKQKLQSFRRITREDTITARSIGKVHYIKRNGTIEYYTEAGYHPVEVTRKLHPLTYYMYKTHLAND